MSFSLDQFIASDEHRQAIRDAAYKHVEEAGGRWDDLPGDIAENAVAELLCSFDPDHGGPGLDLTLREAAQLIGIMDEDGEWR